MNRVQFFNIYGSNIDDPKNDKITDICDDLIKKYFENINKITAIFTDKKILDGAYH